MGSRSSWSSAEVSAYVTTLTGSIRSNSAQAVGSKDSHFVPDSPSMRFSFTSPPPVFSSLARTSVTLSVTLPGIPAEKPPSIPDARFLPSGPSSTVLRQSGCFSSASKDELKVRSPAGFWPFAAEVAAAAVGAVTSRTSEAAISAAVLLCLLREPCRGCMPSHSSRGSALGQRCHRGTQEPVGSEVAAGVKGVGSEAVFESTGMRKSLHPKEAARCRGIREVSTRERLPSKPAFDLAQLATSGLYLSASAQLLSNCAARGDTGAGQRGTTGAPAVRYPRAPHCIDQPEICTTQAQLTAVAGPFA